MLNAFLRFNRGLLKMPRYAQGWLGLMMIVNAVVPLFYLGRVEAQAVLGIFLINVALMIVLTKASGFSRLLGAGHFPWFVLMGFLLLRLGHLPADDFFGLWIRAVIVLNAVSLVIDVVDVVRYVRGDRAELVEGL